MLKHIKEKFTFFFCLLILLPLTAVCAEEIQDSANLFIHSNPINAAIIIDGEPVLEQTPALIRDLPPGNHTIALRKDGFAGAEKSVNLEEGVTSVIEFELSRGTIITEMPDENTVYLRTNEDILIPGPFRLPEGRFLFKKEDNSLYITPVYPKNELLTVTGTLLASSFTAAVIAAIIELDNKGELYLPHSDGLIITEALTAVFGLTELALLLINAHSTEASNSTAPTRPLSKANRKSCSMRRGRALPPDALKRPCQLTVSWSAGILTLPCFRKLFIE